MPINLSKYNKAIHSKDGKNVAKNFAYLSILQVVGYLFPLITIPYLARVIGVEGFGRIAFAFSIIVWVQTVVDWGFNYTATRDVAKNRDNAELVSEIFSNVFWARCILMSACFVLLCIAVLLVPKFRENAVAIFATFLMVPGFVMFPEWFFQAVEKMKYITILNVLEKTIFTILILCLVKNKEDYYLQPLFTSIGYMCSGFISLYIILVRWHIKISVPNIKSVFKTIKDSTNVFINTLAPNLYNSFSVILLGFWGGTFSNGILDAGTKFTLIFQRFIEIISRAFFPFLSRKINGHTLYAKATMAVSLFLSVSVFLCAPLLIRLFYSEEFSDAILVLRISSLSLLFVALGQAYGINYMIISGYERILRNITLRWSLVGFFISFPFIYFFDYVGAVLTITLIRGLTGGNIMFTALNIKNKQTLLQ